MQHSKNVYPIERIIAFLTYMSVGLVGFIWLIISALAKKQTTTFLMYHILQSIFLSILFFLLNTFAELIYVILYRIPFINAIPYFVNMPLPFLFGLSIIQAITTLILLYLSITAFLGLYSYLPWVSDVIKSNIGHK